MTSSSVALGPAKAMLSRMVPANRNGSWGTTPSWRRSESMVTSRRSWPSIATRPRRVVEAGDELGDGRLARAGRPDEGHRLARGDVQVDVAQHRLGRVVAEGHVSSVTVALDRRQRPRVLGASSTLGCVPSSSSSLVIAAWPCWYRLYCCTSCWIGQEERVEVEDEGGELADGERAVAHHVAADQQQHRLAEQPDELGARAVDRGELGGVVVGVAVVADDVAVVQHVVAGPVEPGDDAHARQALGEVGQHAGDAVAHAVVALVRRRPEPQRQAGEERARPSAA